MIRCNTCYSYVCEQAEDPIAVKEISRLSDQLSASQQRCKELEEAWDFMRDTRAITGYRLTKESLSGSEHVFFTWYLGKEYEGETPLEAIQNAMRSCKEENE